ncbi:copper chaperone [Thermanaerovibrio velox DSM 12556]|uniref:Copper chaperone n=1 Tax=Thermanaerovibrio velox DSM 12556 TaxID=926567 RepID=H0USM2_9BACT|nr:heavy metal-associated domain-containing protein [Thermanaerovibrio velox]EHM10311.1 copper chaperone [Thermanaerovibrio velox DSM 12556]
MMSIKVEDMSCGHCVDRISKALREAGVEDFTVDLSSKKVILQSDDRGSLETALEAIEEAGYDCREGE